MGIHLGASAQIQTRDDKAREHLVRGFTSRLGVGEKNPAGPKALGLSAWALPCTVGRLGGAGWLWAGTGFNLDW